MLPNRFTAPRDTSAKRGLPLGVLIVGGGALLLAALLGWVMVGMGDAPEQVPVNADVDLKL